MKKCCVIADFLSDRNKRDISDCAAENGFEAVFFEDNREADGKVSGTEILYAGGGASIIPQMPDLRWCHTAFAGVGPYVESGVFGPGKAILTNSSGAYGRAIGEHVIMVTLMLMRQMPEYSRVIARHGWDKDLPIRSIAESSIVIAGTGDVGSGAAIRFKALGAKKVTGFNRSGRAAEAFDEVYPFEQFDDYFSDPANAAETDVLLLCVPGTAESEGLLSDRRIRMLSPKTFVINVGRGAVVDQAALTEALYERRIAGAALDVMTPEPLPEDDPLWTAPNCIITPHISGDMCLPYTVDRTVEFFCENMRHYTAGEEMIKLVDVSKGY